MADDSKDVLWIRPCTWARICPGCRSHAPDSEWIWEMCWDEGDTKEFDVFRCERRFCRECWAGVWHNFHVMGADIKIWPEWFPDDAEVPRVIPGWVNAPRQLDPDVPFDVLQDYVREYMR